MLFELPDFTQESRVFKYKDSFLAQFLYKGYEISIAKNSRYAVIDVGVYLGDNVNPVFRGLTPEHCIDWINSEIERKNNANVATNSKTDPTN